MGNKFKNIILPIIILVVLTLIGWVSFANVVVGLGIGGVGVFIYLVLAMILKKLRDDFTPVPTLGTAITAVLLAVVIGVSGITDGVNIFVKHADSVSFESVDNASVANLASMKVNTLSRLEAEKIDDMVVNSLSKLEVPEAEEVYIASATQVAVAEATEVDIASATQVAVAEATEVDIGTVKNDVNIEVVEGDANIKNVEGDLNVENVEGDAHIENVGGNVYVDTTQPPVTTTSAPSPKPTPDPRPVVTTAATTEPPHTHVESGWKYNSAEHWKVCTSCGKELSRGTHNYTERVIRRATEYTDGLKEVYCSTCGYVYGQETIPATHKHSYSNAWKYDSYNHWHECSCGDKSNIGNHTRDSGTVITQPTEYSEGVKVYKCSICGCELSRETIAKLQKKAVNVYFDEAERNYCYGNMMTVVITYEGVSEIPAWVWLESNIAGAQIDYAYEADGKTIVTRKIGGDIKVYFNVTVPYTHLSETEGDQIDCGTYYLLKIAGAQDPLNVLNECRVFVEAPKGPAPTPVSD